MEVGDGGSRQIAAAKLAPMAPTLIGGIIGPGAVGGPGTFDFRPFSLEPEPRLLLS